jgi:hypothetical protein
MQFLSRNLMLHTLAHPEALATRPRIDAALRRIPRAQNDMQRDDAGANDPYQI